MKIFFKLMPRRSGKTTTCIKLLSESPENTILIVRGEGDSLDVLKRKEVRGLKNVTLNIFHSGETAAIEQALNTGKITNIIIDEFLIFGENCKKIHQLLHRTMQNIQTVKIYSSTRKRYDKRILDMMMDYKTAHSSFVDCPFQDEEAKELFYNFLSDPQTTIIVSLLNSAGVDYGTFYEINKQTPLEEIFTEFNCILFK
jgi:U3 small nucleolar RNA-associated protein 14